MKPLAVLFDLDGTLLDTLEDLADSMNEVLRSRHLATHPVEAFRLFVGDGVGNLVRRALPPELASADDLAAQCVSQMNAAYARRWRDKTRVYDGVSELLDQLTGRGLSISVLSNKPHDFVAEMVRHFLSRWQFSAVFGDLPPRPRKPDPQGALGIAKLVGIDPGLFLYLGDSNTDMLTATSAGMYPVGALWGFRGREELLAAGARHLAEHPMDLLRVIE